MDTVFGINLLHLHFSLLFSCSNLIQVRSFYACILINTEVCGDGIKLHVFKAWNCMLSIGPENLVRLILVSHYSVILE